MEPLVGDILAVLTTRTRSIVASSRTPTSSLVGLLGKVVEVHFRRVRSSEELSEQSGSAPLLTTGSTDAHDYGITVPVRYKAPRRTADRGRERFGEHAHTARMGRRVTRRPRQPEHRVNVAGRDLGESLEGNRGRGYSCGFPGTGTTLVKHSYGPLNWELPGGVAEPDETPTETAVREVVEETGLQVSAERLTGVYHEHQAPGREALHFVFLCRVADETAVAQPSSSEITACRYWAPEAFPRPISDFTVRRIRDALAQPGPVLPVVIPPRQWLP